jgi:ABC-type branched-subunit amino acid transport system substrate-binding protein
MGPSQSSASGEMPMSRSRAFVLVIALTVLTSVASACRGDDSAGVSSQTSAPPTTINGASQTKFGDLPSPCGKGDARGATDQGVTDSGIRVGTMSDATASLQPGLNQELWDASKAFVAWCNAQGGINGRPIEDKQYETKLFEAKQRTIEACAREFMLVGGGAAFDDEVAPERVKCGLPDVPAFNATIAATKAPGNFNPLPTPFDKLPAGEAFYLAKQHPDSVKKAGLLAPNFPSAVNIATRARRAYEGAGWTFVGEQLYNPAGEANWTGIVSSLRSKGVDALLYAGTYEPLVAFLQSASEQNWKPTILIGTSTIFTPNLVKEAGAAAEGALSYTNIVPFSDAAPGTATAMYLDLLDKYVKKANHGLLGANSMSAWLLWATAAKACGSELTRKCVTTKVLAVHKWTAGGLHAVSDPGAGKAPPCFILVEVKNGAWARAHPDKGFDCDDSYVVPTAGAYK